MTIAEVLKLAMNRLSAGQINNPPLEAEILLSAILKKSREFILAHGEVLLLKKQNIKYQQLLKRRLKGEPVAYLIGHKEFYGLDFIVNKSVLIPRPETELLVEEALRLIIYGTQPATLVDVGTGSGCIVIALAKNNENHRSIPIDISAKALVIAKLNAKAHGVDKRIKFIKGDLLQPIINKLTTPLIILANLPYGWAAWKNNCSLDTIGLKFEPPLALFTDKNGLGHYEKLFRQIKALTANQSAVGYVLCEFDPRQTAAIKRLIKPELPEARLQIKKDLSGLNRLAIITINA